MGKDLYIASVTDKEFKKQRKGNDPYAETLTICKFPKEISVRRTGKRKAILEINYKKIYEFILDEEIILVKESQKSKNNIQYRNIETPIDKDNNIFLTNVKENDILTVWFNAWRYEHEGRSAVIPLLKTIAYSMGEHPFYYNIKPIFLRGLEILSKDIIHNIATRYLFTKEGLDEFENNLVPKLQRLPEIDKNTTYFDGLKKVEDEIRRTREKYPRSRIVVFIHDLDRCSPETAVEIFESIKVFLDIEGFVFIVGLSRDLLDKMITIKFEKAANDYIRKIIQIEINIQDWNDASVKDELLFTIPTCGWTSTDDRYRDDPYQVQVYYQDQIMIHKVKPY